MSVEPRIQNVEVAEETITAHLFDGRVISVPLAWSGACLMQHLNNGTTLRSSATAKVYTGPILMKILALKACCMEFQRIGLRKSWLRELLRYSKRKALN